MKRYVSLAGAMLLGTVVCQEKVVATTQTEVAAKAVELQAAPAVALEAKKIYRSDVSAYTPSPDTHRSADDKVTSRRSEKNVMGESFYSYQDVRSSASPSSADHSSNQVRDYDDWDHYSEVHSQDWDHDVMSYEWDYEVMSYDHDYDYDVKSYDYYSPHDVQESYDWDYDVRSYEWEPDVRSYDYSPSPYGVQSYEWDYDVRSYDYSPYDVQESYDWDYDVRSYDYDYDVQSYEWDYEVRDRRSVSRHDYDDIKVKIERGYVGICGTRYQYPNGDTYWCDDRQLGLRTHCQIISTSLHMCCVDTDGCDEPDDMKYWRF